MKIIEILQESVNMVISVKTLDGVTYKGQVVEVDDYMNVFLKNVDVFCKSEVDEVVSFKSEICVRGSCIKYLVLPPILKYLKKVITV